MISKQEYLRAKEAVIISAKIQLILELANGKHEDIDVIGLENLALRLNDVFYHGYADYVDSFEPETSGLESGMRWESFDGNE